MNKVPIATALLVLTVFCGLPINAESGEIPLSHYDGQQQVMVDEETLNAYHNEIAIFYKDSDELRHQIWEKSHLFARLLTNPDTSKTTIMDLQQEIQLLTVELQKEELSFHWDLNAQFPQLATDRYRNCLSAATGTIGPGR